MNPSSRKNPPATPATPKPPKVTTEKKRSVNLKTLAPKLKKVVQIFSAHFSFIVIIGVLLVYLYLIWNIRALVTAEPTIEAETEALTATKVPQIDQNAIKRIQALERNSADIQTLFNQARNNPFNE